MDGDLSPRDDPTLLARWARDGSEEAFAEIVRCYQRLVLGAALRRTGDAELARDVAQQVFATLAAKAHLLMGRTSLAGWLYKAASHIAVRAAQSEIRRRIHPDDAADSSLAQAADARWPLLEEALAALGMTERESLVLHYFQDLAYPEIAMTLGIQEAAARKRVSRALRSLEKQMRRRGLCGSPAPLLVGAAALQCSISAQTNLASAAIAASATTSVPWLTFTTIMSHTSVKIAASALALATVPILFQWQANAALRAEIAAVRSAPLIAINTPPLRESRAALEADLAGKRAARIAAQNRAGELSALRRTLDEEVVISLGTIDSMARKLGRIISTLAEFDADNAKKLPPGPDALKEKEKRAREVAEAMPEVMSIIRELPKLERDKTKAARFYATMFGEVAGFDKGVRTTMEKRFETWLETLQQEGLALPQRPQGTAPEWDARRHAATLQLFDQLKATLPVPEKSRPRLDEIFIIPPEGDHGLYEMATTGGQP